MQNSTSFASFGQGQRPAYSSFSKNLHRKRSRSAPNILLEAAVARRQTLYTQIPFIATHGLQARSNMITRNISQQSLTTLLKNYDKSQLQDGSDLESKEDIEAELSEDVVTAPLLMAVLVAIVAQFLNGYNTSVMNAPEAVVFPGHTTLEWSLAVSSFAIGAPLGSIVGGVVANKYGRRPALLLDAWCFVAGGCLMAAAPSVSWLVAARGLIGFASGFSTVVVPVYLGELAPPVLRGTFGTCTQFALVMGILAADALAAPLSRPGVFGWRALFAVTALLAIAQLACAPYIHESPRWLLSRDAESAEAHATLKKLYGFRDDDEVRPAARAARTPSLDRAGAQSTPPPFHLARLSLSRSTRRRRTSSPRTRRRACHRRGAAAGSARR